MVENNINKESLQDSYRSNTDVDGWGISGSNIGFNILNGYDKTNTDWVNNQTSIIGSNSINITTNNNTNLVGSVVASGSYDSNEQKSSNLNIGLGVNLILQYQTSGSDKEQTTYATLGNGTITVGGDSNSDLTGLNRDVNSSQVITKDQTVDTIEGNVKFGIEDKSAKDALQSWVRADKALTGAVKEAAKNAGNYELVSDIGKLETGITKGITVASGTVVNVLTAMYDVITDEKTTMSDLSSQVSNSQRVLNKQQDYDRNTINELGVDDKTIKEIKTATNGDANVYYDGNDVDENGNQKYGKHDDDTNTSYLNAANGVASDTELFIETLGHELTHDNTKSEVIADNVGDYAVTAWVLGNFLAGTEIVQSTTYLDGTSNATSASSWLNNQTSTTSGVLDLTMNNFSASNIFDESDKTYHGIRGVNVSGLKEIANHSFDLYIPDNPENFTKEEFEKKGINYIEPAILDDGTKIWVMGGYDENGNLVAKFNQELDVDLINELLIKNNTSNFRTELRTVNYSNNIDDTTFGYNLIQNTQNYINNTESSNAINYGLNPAYQSNSFNCNSFSNSLLNNSGAILNRNNDYNGADWGRFNLIDNNYFIKK